MEKICGIYCIENKINHKKYIGKSVDIKKRWNDHIRELNRDNHCNKYLQSSWNKYGQENFSFYVVEEIVKDTLSEREIYWIEALNTMDDKYGYNLSKGGDGGNTIVNYTEEELLNYKKKRSVLNRSYIKKGEDSWASKLKEFEVKQIIKELLDGKNCTELSKKYNVSMRTINDIRCRKTWKYLTEDIIFPPLRTKNLKARKAVVQYNIDGTIVNTFSGAIEAEEKTGISKKLISAVCHGNKRIAQGYIWRFEGDSFNKYNVRNPHEIPVDKYDLEGNFIKTYPTIKAAQKDCKTYSIKSVLNGKTKTAGGFIWKKHIY